MKTKMALKILILTIASIMVLTSCSGGDFNADKDITVVSREDGSGTRGAFTELVGIEKEDTNGNKQDLTTEDAVISNSTSIVITNVSTNPQAIGYISLGSLNDSVKALKVNGIEVNIENIKNGSYEIARPFNIATKTDISELAQDFIDYIMSSEGQAIIEDSGYISVSNTGVYAGSKPSGKITVAGSSSVTPVMEKLKEGYVKINTDATIEIQQSASSTGMTSAIDGICDIGMASRELKDSEIEKGLIPKVIAMDGIAVIVNNKNTVTDITTEEIMKIFTGEITVWSYLI